MIKRKNTLELLDIYRELYELEAANWNLEVRLMSLLQETKSELVKKQIKKLLSFQSDIKYNYKEIKDFAVEWQKSYDEAMKNIAKK